MRFDRSATFALFSLDYLCVLKTTTIHVSDIDDKDYTVLYMKL